MKTININPPRPDPIHCITVGIFEFKGKLGIFCIIE